jgi:hypothetical protein
MPIFIPVGKASQLPFAPKADNAQINEAGPLCAKTGCEQTQQTA